MKKTISVLLTLVMALSFAGCGKNKDDNGGETARYYKTEHADTIKIDQPLAFARRGENLILVGTAREKVEEKFQNIEIDGVFYEEYADEYNTVKIKAAVFDLGGKLLSETELLAPNIPNTACINQDGTILLVINEYDYRQTSGASNYLSTHIAYYGADGVQLRALELGKLETRSEHPNITQFTASGGFLYFLFDAFGAAGYLRVYGDDGTFLFELDGITAVAELSDGRVAAKREATGGQAVFSEIDVEKKGLGADLPMTPSAQTYDVGYASGNDEFPLFECTKTSVVGYSAENGESAELFRWMSQSVDSSMFRFVAAADGAVFALEHDSPENAANWQADGGTLTLIRFAESDTPPENQASDKKTVTLAAITESSMLRYTVLNYNKSSKEYEIKLKTYWDAGDWDNYDNALNSLNLDIVAGRVPDIIAMDSSMNIGNYVSKGVLADLYPLIDADSDMRREDYIPNILKLFETDGKLYGVSPSFRVSTIAGKTSDVGDRYGWTWEDYHALLARKPAGITPISNPYFPISGESYLINTALASLFADFVDYGAGKCYFDSPEFIECLKTAAFYPSEADVNALLAEGNIFRLTGFKDGDPLLARESVSGFSPWGGAIKENEIIDFGEPVTYIGFPTADGTSGNACGFDERFSVAAKSEVIDGAFEYIKYLLTDYQYTEGGDINDTGAIRGFPVKTDALEKQAEAAKNNKSGLIMHVDGVQVEIPGAWTDEQIQTTYDLIYSVNYLVVYDSKITAIVSEEASFYFSGQKTAEQTAAIIQDRVSTYLSEMN